MTIQLNFQVYLSLPGFIKLFFIFLSNPEVYFILLISDINLSFLFFFSTINKLLISFFHVNNYLTIFLNAASFLFLSATSYRLYEEIHLFLFFFLVQVIKFSKLSSWWFFYFIYFLLKMLALNTAVFIDVTFNFFIFHFFFWQKFKLLYFFSIQFHKKKGNLFIVLLFFSFSCYFLNNFK